MRQTMSLCGNVRKLSFWGFPMMLVGLAHLSSLGWEHINLTEDYVGTSYLASENTNEMWPSRASQGNCQSRVKAA